MVLWAEVDTTAETEERKFKRIYTGRCIEGVYVDTVQSGPLVWHLYEV